MSRTAGIVTGTPKKMCWHGKNVSGTACSRYDARQFARKEESSGPEKRTRPSIAKAGSKSDSREVRTRFLETNPAGRTTVAGEPAAGGSHSTSVVTIFQRHSECVTSARRKGKIKVDNSTVANHSAPRQDNRLENLIFDLTLLRTKLLAREKQRASGVVAGQFLILARSYQSGRRPTHRALKRFLHFVAKERSA